MIPAPCFGQEMNASHLLGKLKRYECKIHPLPSFDQGMVTSGGVAVTGNFSKNDGVTQM
jgi:hypothetical protein